MTDKLTPWYPGHIKPVHIGVYQQKDGFGKVVGYQYWNGQRWGLWGSTIESALFQYEVSAGDRWQNDSWRGLTKRK
jgi:hypothetical protein